MYIYIRSGYVCIYVNRYVHKHVYIYICKCKYMYIYIYIYPGAAERPGGHWFPVAKSESVSAQAKQDYVSLQSRICECSASVLWVSGMLKDCPKASNNSLEDQHANATEIETKAVKSAKEAGCMGKTVQGRYELDAKLLCPRQC